MADLICVRETIRLASVLTNTETIDVSSISILESVDRNEMHTITIPMQIKANFMPVRATSTTRQYKYKALKSNGTTVCYFVGGGAVFHAISELYQQETGE